MGLSDRLGEFIKGGAKRAKRAKESVRVKRAECGLSPLCEPCGFRERPNIPEAWQDLPAGASYPCDSPLIGTSVTFRDGVTAEVVSCATPIGPSLLQTNRVSDRYACQGAYTVRSPLGFEWPVPKSIIHERQRLERRGGVCEHTGSDLPWPHRPGSHVGCFLHPQHDPSDPRVAETWLRHQERQTEGRGAYRARVSEAKRARAAQGWESGEVISRRSPAEERAKAKLRKATSTPLTIDTSAPGYGVDDDGVPY